MKLKSNIDIYANGKIIANCDNLITDVGKQIFIDWLQQPSYANNNVDIPYKGAFLNNGRFLTNNEVNYHFTNTVGTTADNLTQTGDILYDFADKTNYRQFVKGTVYATFNQIDCLGVCINAKTILNNSYYPYMVHRVKIYASSADSIEIANNTKSWSLIKITYLNKKDDYSTNKIIRFDDMYSADGVYESLKLLKFEFTCDGDYSNEYAKVRLYGIGILKRQSHINVPCAIGLGTGLTDNSVPTVADKNLDESVIKLFVNNQQGTISIDGKQYNDFDFNDNLKLYLSKLDEQPKKVGFNISYISRLNYHQCNNLQITQIGLFYAKNAVNFYNDDINSCTQLFSHGKFATPWTKNSTQVVDIKYTITIQADFKGM